MRAGLFLSGLLVTVALSGCTSSGARPRRSEDVVVEQLRLLTSPTVVNFDNRPGPDGLLAQVYAFGKGSAKAIRLTDGTLEITLFDGQHFEYDESARSIWTRRIEADELRQLGHGSLIGVGYGVQVRWGESVPTRHDVTLFARYERSDGEVVESAGVSLPLRLR